MFISNLPIRLSILMTALLSLVCLGQEPDATDHDALRALLKGATTSINEQKFENLKDFFHSELRVTTVNQESIVKPEGLEPYFRSWVGPDQYVTKMSMTMEADELTEFYGSGPHRFGIARGKGIEDYQLKDGRHLKLDTRWTATVSKDKDGQWKILALHLGANFYNNPIVDQFQRAGKMYGYAGLAMGFLVGALVSFFLMRRNRN